jgi:hypothetical protein
MCLWAKCRVRKGNASGAIEGGTVLGSAAVRGDANDTFAKLLRAHAAVRGARPAFRHKDFGLWHFYADSGATRPGSRRSDWKTSPCRSRRPAPITSHSATFVQQWEQAKWLKVSDLVSPDTAKVEPLLDDAAKAYAEKNAGWPARTEACANK